MNKQDVEKRIRKVLTAELKRMTQNFSDYRIIRNAISEYNHKRFDKKIEKFLPKGYAYEVGVNGPKIKTPSGTEHFVCYTNETPTPELFDERDACYRLESQRADELYQFLEEDIREFDAYVDEVCKMIEAYKFLGSLYSYKHKGPHGEYQVREEFGVHYNVLRLANIHPIK